VKFKLKRVHRCNSMLLDVVGKQLSDDVAHSAAAAGVCWTPSSVLGGRSSWRRQRQPGRRDTVRAVAAEQAGTDADGPREAASLPAARPARVRRR